MDECLKLLIFWYQKNKRELPWRVNSDFYRVWVSEIMLQQTQVKTVIPFFNRFMKKFPNLYSLAEAPIEDVLKCWAGLGYYSRAKNLHKAAKIVDETKIPKNKEELLTLPGIGPYTAGAISSIAFHQPSAILDANVKRVLSRIRQIKKSAKEKKRVWRLSKILVQRAFQLGFDPSDFNQALMELGALVCKIESPNCTICAFQNLCKAYQKETISLFPSKVKRKEKLSIKEKVFFYFCADSNSFLLELDSSKRWHKGLWDLPKKEIIVIEKVKKGSFNLNYTITKHSILREIEVFYCSQKNLEEKLYKKNCFKLYSFFKEELWPAMPSVCKKALLYFKKEMFSSLF